MKGKSIFLFFIMTITIFMVSIFPVSAQDIDIESMDNAQLMELLQSIMQNLAEPTSVPTAIPTPTATPQPIPDVSQISDNEQLMALMQEIMQKLAADGNGEKSESFTEEPASPELVVTLLPESTPEPVHFQIYENKKLILERIPDDRFIPKDNGKEEKPDKDKKKPDSTPDCPPDQNGDPCSWSIRFNTCVCG